jgi:2C-methyl-D-erythritol 2,4-cyclodiphosphate synthase
LRVAQVLEVQQEILATQEIQDLVATAVVAVQLLAWAAAALRAMIYWVHRQLILPAHIKVAAAVAEQLEADFFPILIKAETQEGFFPEALVVCHQIPLEVEAVVVVRLRKTPLL